MSDPCEQHIRALNREAAKKKVEELIGRLRAKNRPLEQAAAILAHVSNPTTPSEGYFEIDYGFGDLVVDKGLFKAPLLKGAPGQAPKPCARCLTFQDDYHKHTPPPVPVPLLLNLSKNLEVFRVFKDVISPKEEPGTRKKKNSPRISESDKKTKEREKVTAFRTVPINYRGPGEVIGLFEGLRDLLGRDPYYGPFYVSAGTRNCHLALPLTDHSTLLKHLISVLPVGDHRTLFNTLITTGQSRVTYQKMDAQSYGLGDVPKDALRGIASDWRWMRDAIEDTDWAATMLMLPPNFLTASRSSSEQSSLLQILFKAGFEQLQDALEAFAEAEDGDHDHDTRIFMNVEEPSVPLMLDHLRRCISGERFVHHVASEDGNGPWAVVLRKLQTLNEVEVIRDGYAPVVLEPRLLDQNNPGPAIVSFVHPLVPHGIYFAKRENIRWIADTKWSERMDLHKIRDFAQIYPYESNDQEDLSDLSAKNVTCWPSFKGDHRKLSRKTSLREFMTVRFRPRESRQLEVNR